MLAPNNKTNAKKPPGKDQPEGFIDTEVALKNLLRN